ncbi:NADH dehydrogenase [ubiquinone] complex I, assembly factor 7 [Trichinella pseudospiralis]|uniref:type II protein arginine methyltransferase n=1 Tax=Trichinella pseudospiralis TaxID=6337 RepID=A0A0V1DZ65_TRIPS|nr:NADH dehydrogenase [ubiquinone] complex I, assembly factor 7 [Trichinella pseudospiralis]
MLSFKNIFIKQKIRNWLIFAPTVCFANGSQKRTLLELLTHEIRLRGPITVAQYMHRTLTCPVYGYYTTRSCIFGNDGDFLTSPEVSQIFGEILALWCVQMLDEVCHEGPFNLVELGPGSGKLMQDMLRTMAKFKLCNKISVHLVEISDKLARQQEQLLCPESTSASRMDSIGKTACYKKRYTSSGIPLHWHRDVEDLPKAFSLVIAQEFFDAMPIHKFQHSARGWREVLVDVDEHASTRGDERLKFCLASSKTVTQRAFLDEKLAGNLEAWEISPASVVVLRSISKLITEYGGAMLIVDYGHDGEKGDTLRAFSNHQIVDPLQNPGMVDLTADVNFCYLKKQLENLVVCFGPVTQGEFLHRMGVGFRLQQLLGNVENESQRDYLNSSCDYLVNNEKMGSHFKIFEKVTMALRFTEGIVSKLAKVKVSVINRTAEISFLNSSLTQFTTIAAACRMLTFCSVSEPKVHNFLSRTTVVSPFAVYSVEAAENTGSVNEENEGEERKKITSVKRRLTQLMKKYDYPSLPVSTAYQYYTKECFEKAGKGLKVHQAMPEFAKSWKRMSHAEKMDYESKMLQAIGQFSDSLKLWEASLKERRLGGVLKAIILGIKLDDSKQLIRRLLKKELDHLKERHDCPLLKFSKPYRLFMHEKLKTMHRDMGDSQQHRLRSVSDQWNAMTAEERRVFKRRADQIAEAEVERLDKWRQAMFNRGLSDVVDKIDWLQAQVGSLKPSRKKLSLAKLTSILDDLSKKSKSKAPTKESSSSSPPSPP